MSNIGYRQFFFKPKGKKKIFIAVKKIYTKADRKDNKNEKKNIAN